MEEQKTTLEEPPEFTPYPEIWTRSYRAWVLVKVKGRNPDDVAGDIFELNGGFDKDTQGFIVRADVISVPTDFEIVVPVNASSDAKRTTIINSILNVDSVVSVSILYVKNTIPEKAHRAVGYIPYNERNQMMGIDGFNSWG
jgi:hypothetical protein